MARCDLCSNNCPAHMLETLPPFEQAAGVADLCPTCTQRVNKIRRDLVATLPAQMRAVITEIKEIKAPLPNHREDWHSLMRRFTREIWS